MGFPELHREIDLLINKHLQNLSPEIRRLTKENAILRNEMKWYAENLENFMNWPKEIQERDVRDLKKQCADKYYSMIKTLVAAPDRERDNG